MNLEDRILQSYDQERINKKNRILQRGYFGRITMYHEKMSLTDQILQKTYHEIMNMNWSRTNH